MKPSEARPSAPARIEYLKVQNFRALREVEIKDLTPLTVLLGPNGSGKSNILEAIGLLAAARLRSVDTDLDLVRFGAGEAKIEGKVEGQNEREKGEYI